MSKQGVLLPIHNFSDLKSLANNAKIRTSLIKNFYLHSIFCEVLTCSKENIQMWSIILPRDGVSKLNLFCSITPTLSKGFWAALKWFRMTSDTRLTSVNKPENNQWKMSVSLKTTNEKCQWAWKQPMKDVSEPENNQWKMSVSLKTTNEICQWAWKQPMKDVSEPENNQWKSTVTSSYVSEMKMKIYIWIQK